MPVRGLFGVAPYQKPRVEGSAVFKIQIPLATTPPRQRVVLTPDPRPPYPQEAGAFYKVVPIFTETIQVKRYWDTPIPIASYVTVLNFVRGFAGAAAVAPSPPPVVVFWMTDVPFGDRKQDGGAFFPPGFLQNDIFSMGVFMNTSSPSKAQAQPYTVDSVYYQPPIFLPTTPTQIRTFIPQPLSYANPWKQEGSSLYQPIPVSFIFPFEIPRFVNPVPPWKSSISYVTLQSSWVLMPQIANAPPPPPLPPGGHNIWPPIHRRKMLLFKLW